MKLASPSLACLCKVMHISLVSDLHVMLKLNRINIKFQISKINSLTLINTMLMQCYEASLIGSDGKWAEPSLVTFCLGHYVYSRYCTDLYPSILGVTHPLHIHLFALHKHHPQLVESCNFFAKPQCLYQCIILIFRKFSLLVKAKLKLFLFTSLTLY